MYMYVHMYMNARLINRFSMWLLFRFQKFIITKIEQNFLTHNIPIIKLFLSLFLESYKLTEADVITIYRNVIFYHLYIKS